MALALRSLKKSARAKGFGKRQPEAIGIVSVEELPTPPDPRSDREACWEWLEKRFDFQTIQVAR
jgi:hypothetical protein